MIRMSDGREAFDSTAMLLPNSPRTVTAIPHMGRYHERDLERLRFVAAEDFESERQGLNETSAPRSRGHLL